MPERQNIENAVLRALISYGYSQQMARWVADNLPATFHMLTAEQRVSWLFDEGWLAIWEDPAKLALIEAGIEPDPKKYKIQPDMIFPGWQYESLIADIGQRAAFWSAEATLGPERQRQVAQTEVERQRLRDQATVRAMQEREREVMEAAAGEVAGFKTPGQITAEAVERGRGISPAFSRFARGVLPDIFEELGMAQKRRQWQEEFIRGSTGALPPVRPRSEGEEALRLADVEWEKGMPGFQRSRDILRRSDPWAQLLQQPTFLEQLENRFRSLTPQERGFRAGRTRPRTRFL